LRSFINGNGGGAAFLASRVPFFVAELFSVRVTRRSYGARTKKSLSSPCAVQRPGDTSWLRRTHQKQFVITRRCSASW
jgi:hypothetical protein